MFSEPWQFYFVLAPNDVQTPTWLMNFDLNEGCMWQHVPTKWVPPVCVPLALRSGDQSSSIATHRNSMSVSIFSRFQEPDSIIRHHMSHLMRKICAMQVQLF